MRSRSDMINNLSNLSAFKTFEKRSLKDVERVCSCVNVTDDRTFSVRLLPVHVDLLFHHSRQPQMLAWQKAMRRCIFTNIIDPGMETLFRVMIIMQHVFKDSGTTKFYGQLL